MNTLLGFGGLANTGLTAASAYKSRPRMNNNNNNNYVPFQNTRKRVSNMASKLTSKVGSIFGKKANQMPTPTPAPVVSAAPSLNLYKSKAASALRARTRKNKPVNNTHVASNTQAPNVNLSYVKNRNNSVRNALNQMMVGRSFNRSTPNLSNSQRAARIEVARKMARGEPVDYFEKVRAGMVTIPKPKGPRPTAPNPMGGKRSRKASRRRRTVRRR